MFTQSFLRGLRSKAFRRRIWFKALDGMDRSFYNLVCIVVDRVKSPVLGRQILGLVLKLRDALKGEFVKLSESFGVMRAWEAAACAMAWGYRDAGVWRRDKVFARFFAVMEYNTPSGWS